MFININNDNILPPNKKNIKKNLLKCGYMDRIIMILLKGGN